MKISRIYFFFHISPYHDSEYRLYGATGVGSGVGMATGCRHGSHVMAVNVSHLLLYFVSFGIVQFAVQKFDRLGNAIKYKYT